MEGDYITKEQYDKLIEAEEDPYRLIYKIMWELGLRVGEIVGTTIENPNKKARKKQRWIKSLPGIILEDVDRVKAKDIGLPCQHTLHIHRKRYKEEEMPLPNDLFDEIIEYARERGVKPLDKLFDVSRVTVYVRLAQMGRVVSGKKPMHPHALRRGHGVYRTAVLGEPIQEVQARYGHTRVSMTQSYIGMDRIEALKANILRNPKQYGVK